MANETFKYPTAASATALGTLTFSITAHSLGDAINIVPNQISDVTQGGIRLTENLGSSFTRYDYTAIIYVASASIDYADVIRFFGPSYANMAENTFVWTEHDATAHTVRMISGLSFTNMGNNLMRVSMTLEDDNA
jgi:hypothetical protein